LTPELRERSIRAVNRHNLLGNFVAIGLVGYGLYGLAQLVGWIGKDVRARATGSKDDRIDRSGWVFLALMAGAIGFLILVIAW
jgi:hypothetical protein